MRLPLSASSGTMSTAFTRWFTFGLLLILQGISGQTRAQSTNISFPGFRSSFITGTTVVIAANAAPASGKTIAKVEFLISSAAVSPGSAFPVSSFTALGEDATSPYTFSWVIPVGQLSFNELRTRLTHTDGTTAISGSNATLVDVYEPNVSSNINYYISPGGSNSNNGTDPNTPFLTIQTGLQIAKPGDVVNVMAGTYALGTGTINFRRTGTPTNWVTLKNYQNDRPVISSTGGNAILVIANVAYARIQGLELVGNNQAEPLSVTLPKAYIQLGSCAGAAGTPPNIYNTNGIFIDARNGANLHPHHIEMKDNIVHDFPGGGISSSQADYLTVENNTIYNNSWLTVYGTSGISFLNSWNFDSHAGATPHMIIRNNRCYNNRLYVRWKNGATNTCKTFDGNGIIVDNNNAAKNTVLGAYTGKFLIENNLSYLNGGRGININYTDNVTILNNTTYQNGQTETVNSPETGEVTDDIDSEFIAQNSANLSVYNNIFFGRSGAEKTIEVNAATITHNNNLVFQNGGTGVPYFTGNQNKTGQDPLFVNAAGGDFQIPNNSPAINAGSNTAGQFTATDILGLSRPQGTAPDIGAFELNASALPVTLSQFTAKPLGERVSVAWSTASEQNSAYFEVERSGSLAEFSRVGRIEAAGESKTTRSYGLLDEKPLAGANYYRLKQVDRDGSVAYSKIVSVVMDNLAPSLEVMGNPTETSTIRVITRNLDGATYLLTTATGQPISLATKPEPNGELVLMPAQPLPTGIYLIQARNGALHLTRKVLVR